MMEWRKHFWHRFCKSFHFFKYVLVIENAFHLYFAKKKEKAVVATHSRAPTAPCRMRSPEEIEVFIKERRALMEQLWAECKTAREFPLYTITDGDAN